MDFQTGWAFQILQGYAYQPMTVYLIVFAMMIASGFGLPLPEEITILSVGFLAYMGRNPDLYPPPVLGAIAVDGVTAALVTTGAVIFADNLVFFMGRFFGRRLMEYPKFKVLFGEKVMAKINSMNDRFGSLAIFVFRFLPGIRFPAHIALGMSRCPVWKFFLVDALAAMISVPTQVMLVYHYGDAILSVLKQFKIVFLVVLVIVAIVYFWRQRRKPALPV
jgi:membrane protein DedA with SNARE-associated domain